MDEELFNQLVESIKDAGKYMRGEATASREFHFAEPDVRAIRERTGLGQKNFAMLIGVSKRTLENWEQGRRKPTGPARALMQIVEADPIGAMRTLYERPRVTAMTGKVIKKSAPQSMGNAPTKEDQERAADKKPRKLRRRPKS